MKSIATLIFFSCLTAGCIDDAPRDNPLDPMSSAYSANGSLSGRIVVANQTTGIPGAMVSNLTEGVSVLTDSSGYFLFEKLSGGVHRCVVRMENFTNDTFQTTIQAGSTVQVIRGLNGAPVTTFRNIVTRKIDQYFPSPQYFVEITSAVSDPNGIADLDSVWFGVDTLRYGLTYSVTTKNFHATMYKYDFPTATIQWLVGKPLTIIARDIHGAENISEPFFVTRVIENEATPLYPSSLNNDTTSTDSLVFKWLPPSVTFNYSYSLILSRVDAGTQTVVWTLDGINSINEEYSFYTHPNRPALIAGNYVWTVSVVDDFGNYGRSKESAFVLQ